MFGFTSWIERSYEGRMVGGEDKARGAGAHTLQALEHISPEQLIVSSDCGFGRQGGNRDIAFFKTTSIAQGANIVRRELGLPVTRIPAADPMPQTDIVPKAADR